MKTEEQIKAFRCAYVAPKRKKTAKRLDQFFRFEDASVQEAIDFAEAMYYEYSGRLDTIPSPPRAAETQTFEDGMYTTGSPMCAQRR